MRIGKDDAEKKIANKQGVSKKEKSLMKKWADNKEEAKVTTLRVYPSTMDQVKKLAKEEYQVIPEYVVMDHVLQLGIKAARTKKQLGGTQ